MFCQKCGEVISDGSVFCSKCGERIIFDTEAEKNKIVFSNSEDTVVVGAVIDEKEDKRKKPQVIHSKKKAIVIAVTAVMIIAIAILTSQAVGKSNLKKQLLRDWSRVETSDETYYTLELNFSEREIEYNFESVYSWLNTTISTMEYEVISPNKIRVLDHDRVIEIEFNDDKSMMTCTPAITSADTSETWFNLE